MESNSLEKLEDLFTYLPRVKIDEGRFKYIQIDVTDNDSKQKVVFIRGYKKLHYHAENFEHFSGEFAEAVSKNNLTLKWNNKSAKTLKLSCPGGGRIEHSAEKKTLFIYGYSQSYGQCDHTITKKILMEKFLDYSDQNVTWSNDGY